MKKFGNYYQTNLLIPGKLALVVLLVAGSVGERIYDGDWNVWFLTPTIHREKNESCVTQNKEV